MSQSHAPRSCALRSPHALGSRLGNSPRGLLHVRALTSFLILTVAAAAVAAWIWRTKHSAGLRHYHQGMEYLKIGRVGAAEQEWIDGTTEDPDDYHCYEVLGDLYAQQGRYADAAACYHAASDHHSTDGTLFFRWANAERGSGGERAALTAAERAYQLMPKSAEAAYLYGTLLQKDQKPAIAVGPLRRAYQLKPSISEYFEALIDAEMSVPDYPAAAADLQSYLKLHPSDVTACFRMASVLSQQPHTPDNLRAGIGYARRAVSGMHGNSGACAVLGELQLDNGEVEEALAAYRLGEQTDPNSEAILRGLSNCYARLGKQDKLAAVEQRFQTVLKRHSRIDALSRLVGADHSDITHGLELISLIEEEGRLDMAREYLIRIAQQAPSDPRIRPAAAKLARLMRSTSTQQAPGLPLPPIPGEIESGLDH